MMRASKQLLIGLPNSGKTTFLIALWHIVESGEIPGSLRLVELHGNVEHLNTLRREWLGCKPLPRTTKAAEKFVAMRLEDTHSSLLAEVFFPHLSGESFREQFEERRCSKQYYDLAREAAGVLLFVQPSDIVLPVRIDAADRIIAEVDACADNSTVEDVTQWSPSRVPTQ